MQVVSLNIDHAKLLADELNCRYADFSGLVDTAAELYIVAVSDGVLYDLKSCIQLNNKLIIHTAGSVSKDVLQDISVNYGVLYPLQSIRKEM